MKVEFVRFQKGQFRMTDGKYEVEQVQTGHLEHGENLSIDTEYVTILKIGDVMIRLGTSEWGNVRLTTKEEVDSYLSGIFKMVYD